MNQTSELRTLDIVYGILATPNRVDPWDRWQSCESWAEDQMLILVSLKTRQIALSVGVKN